MPPARRTDAKPADLPFEDAAVLLKALGHPLRLRLICGLSREPSNLTRIVHWLNTPLSTVALHLGVLRRAGILQEERQGAEVRFRVADERVYQVLKAFCAHDLKQPPENWRWEEIAQTYHESAL